MSNITNIANTLVTTLLTSAEVVSYEHVTVSPWQLLGDLQGTTDTRQTTEQSVRFWVGA